MTINIENNYYNFDESATLYQGNDIPKQPLEMFCKKGILEKIIVTNVGRIVACNHTKNKRTLKNRSNYRTFF